MAATIVVCSDAESCADWEILLRRLGFQVIAAASGDAALYLCARVRPDLVLLDDRLPDMSVTSFCRQLMENPKTQQTPVVEVEFGHAENRASARPGQHARDAWGQVHKPSEVFERVRFLEQLKSLIDEQTHAVIFSLARAIEARDHYEAEHGVRVSNYAVRVGRSLSLSEIEIDALRIGGLLHDIGKIAISETILSKPGRLTAEEIASVRQHPVVGEEICAPLKSLRHVLPVIRHHHERFDGSGYPDGLRGGQIPITAQIVRLVDVCDALTSDRPYRRAMSLPSALLCLCRDAERGWVDERLVHHMAGLILGAEHLTRAVRCIPLRAARYRSGTGPI